MTSCHGVRELMEKARDERLPALIQAALDGHLSSCPDCAGIALLEAGMTEGLAALRAEASELELPEDFRLQVKERLLCSDRSRPSIRWHWASGFTTGLAAAACLALVAVAIVALRGGFTGEVPARIVATGPSVGLPGEFASSRALPPPFDSRTAPLLYASPEVEVIFDGGHRNRSDAQAMRTAAATAEDASADANARTDANAQSGSGRREYHF